MGSVSESRERSLRGKRRMPTKGLGVSWGLEWKISRVKRDSSGSSERGRRKRSFQTGRVEPESSDLVERRRSGSTQKMA